MASLICGLHKLALQVKKERNGKSIYDIANTHVPLDERRVVGQEDSVGEWVSTICRTLCLSLADASAFVLPLQSVLCITPPFLSWSDVLLPHWTDCLCHLNVFVNQRCVGLLKAITVRLVSWHVQACGPKSWWRVMVGDSGGFAVDRLKVVLRVKYCFGVIVLLRDLMHLE